MVDNRTDEHDDPARRYWEAAPDHDATDTPPAQDADRVDAAPDAEPTGATASRVRERAEDDLFRPDASDPEPSEGGSTAAGSAVAGTAAAAAVAGSAEHDRLVAERQARRQARMEALAPKPDPDPAEAYPRQAEGRAPAREQAPVPAATRTETVTVTQRSTDKFAGSLGLFLLRIVTAAIMGIHGLNKLLDLPGTTEMLQQTLIPAPNIMAMVIGGAEVAIAIALVFGLLTRFAGLGVALIAGGALAFVRWGNWSPFVAGQHGFVGELELLLAVVGLLLLLVGGGGWSLDRGFRRRRAEGREA